LSGVQVLDDRGAVIGETDEEGQAKLDFDAQNRPESLRLRKAGYATQVVRVPEDGDEVALKATLVPRDPPHAVQNPENGFTLTGRSGSEVTIPQNGLVYEDTGEVVTGEVKVWITPVDVTRDGNGGFPGSFSGVSMGSADPSLIMSYGTMEVHIETPNGRPVNLAQGKQATIRIPIFVNYHPDGTPIELGDAGQAVWYLDEQTGIWKQESDQGTVVSSPSSPTGLALEVDVPHFSWWNHDIAPSTCRRQIRLFERGGRVSRGNLYLAANIIPDEPVSRLTRPVYRADEFFPQIGRPIELAHSMPVFGKPVILPARMPLKVKGLFSDDAGRVFIAETTFPSGVSSSGPCSATGPLDMELQPAKPQVEAFRVVRVKPVFARDGSGNQVVVANDISLYWRVLGAYHPPHLVLPNGDELRIPARGGRVIRIEKADVPTDGRLAFELKASNVNGTTRAPFVAVFQPVAAPEIGYIELLDNGSGEKRLSWGGVIGANNIEWGFMDNTGRKVRLGSLDAPSDYGETDPFVLPTEAVSVYLRAINGMDETTREQSIGVDGCPEASEGCYIDIRRPS